MEGHGAQWGARQEVVGRSVSALNELLEMMAAEALTKKPVQLDVGFDEFNLDLTLQYEGIPIDTESGYVKPSDLEDDLSTVALSLCLMRRDADRVEIGQKNGRQRVVLHFDH
jgi:NCS2 family nucleobase:cation symporter-2